MTPTSPVTSTHRLPPSICPWRRTTWKLQNWVSIFPIVLPGTAGAKRQTAKGLRGQGGPCGTCSLPATSQLVLCMFPRGGVAYLRSHGWKMELRFVHTFSLVSFWRASQETPEQQPCTSACDSTSGKHLAINVT